MTLTPSTEHEKPEDFNLPEQKFDITRHLKSSNLPPGTRLTHRFETWVHREELVEALEATRRFLSPRAKHHFLTLAGECGCGKTHLAIAAAWDNLEATGLTTCYWQTGALMHYLRGLYDKDRHPAQPAIDVELRWLCKCSLLVLDDLGTEASTEWTTSILDQIVDTRYINCMKTIFTTNATPQNLPRRVVDRMMEGTVITIAAKSYRRLNKDKEVQPHEPS